MEASNPLLPPIRYELSFYQPNVPGPVFVQDPMGYIAQQFSLKEEVIPFLSFFDGSKRLSHLINAFSHLEGIESFSKSLIRQLDEALLFKSDHFKNECKRLDQTFEKSERLHAQYIGNSLSGNPNYWTDYFDLNAPLDGTPDTDLKPIMVFAPHIDFRVEKALYSQTFNLLKAYRYKYILCLGTSHYAGYYPNIYRYSPFICSSKHFKSIYGELKNDRRFFEFLVQNEHAANLGLHFKDRAFRSEHSIEYHLILSQIIWGNEFQFLPILIGGLDEMLYSTEGNQTKQLSECAALIANFLLNKRNLDDCLILVSGDLAHFGPRFGTSDDAKEHHHKIEKIDSNFLKGISSANYTDTFKSIQSHYDHYNHCGYPPAILALKILENLHISTTGRVVGRDFWYEASDKSTVSYGSAIVYREKSKKPLLRG